MLKSIARRLLPRRWHASIYCPNHLEALVRRKTGLCVHTGPFQGMKYVRAAVNSVYLPKVLGTYEKELHGVLRQTAGLAVTKIVDVGAAEGYYAVGLARLLPGVPVVAFELDPAGRSLAAEMAQANDVTGRVTIKGRCELADLAAELAPEPRPLLVCDIEGYEEVLLQPARIPSLSHAWILVELHEGVAPGITRKLRDRFAPTHQVEEILQVARQWSELPVGDWQTRWFPKVYRERVLFEGREYPQSWFWMTPLGAQG